MYKIILLMVTSVTSYNIFPDNFCTKNWTEPSLLRQIGINVVAIDFTVITKYHIVYLKCCITELTQLANKLEPNNSTEFCYTITIENHEIKIENYINVLVNCVGVTSNGTTQQFTEVFYLPQKLSVAKIYPQYFNRPNVNVLMLGLDSISYHQFREKGSITKRFLDSHDAIEMRKFNSLSRHTYKNQMPLIIGWAYFRLKNRCLKNNDLSTCPIVWKYFKQMGYITAFFEEANEMGVFDLVYSLKSMHSHFDYRGYDSYSNALLGHSPVLNSNLCAGPELRFTRMFRNLAIYVTAFKNRPFFAFFWGVTITPHELGYFPQQLDLQISKLLQYFDEQKVFRNTILIFMSDHGSRARIAPKGEIPHAFLYVMLPENYGDEKLVLKRNADKLVNVYDVHATLYDILNRNVTNKFQRFTIYGRSLFTIIPNNRECWHMGIPEHYCRFGPGCSLNMTYTAHECEII